MTFAYDGVAWDKQPWRTCGAITTLGHQIEVVRPGTYPADGTVASRAHDSQNPSSDHTVWPLSGPGIVYAIDIGEPDDDPTFIDRTFEAIRLSHDQRVLYGIHAGRLFSSYPTSQFPAWTWRPYSGYNPHPGHGHLSVRHELGDQAHPWQITTEVNPMPTNPPSGYAADAWKLAGEAGVLTTFSEPRDIITKEQLIVFMVRMGVIEKGPNGKGRIDPDLLGSFDNIFGGNA